MRRILIITLFFILIISSYSISAQLSDSSWPTFHGNNQRTGLSPYDTSHVNGTVKWTYNIGTNAEGSLAIGPDGTLYIGSHDGYLYAISKEGNHKWKAKIGTPTADVYQPDSLTCVRSSPAIGNDGTIYIASRDGYLFSISSEGLENWRFPVDILFDSWASPAIADDGTIYITSSYPTDGLYAINPNGTEKWFYNSTQDETHEYLTSFNSPSIGPDGTIYIGVPTGFIEKPYTLETRIIALNPNGTEKWKTEPINQLESSLAIADDGTIYVGSYSGEAEQAGLYAINSDGNIKWFFQCGGFEIMPTPGIGPDGTIYFGGHNSKFYALNPDGTEKWNITTDGIVESSPAIGSEGTIYFGATMANTNFYALNPNGTVKWRINSDKKGSVVSSPAIGSDGTVYVGGGVVTAYGDVSESKEINSNPDSKSPGFEILSLITTVFLIIYIKKKKG